MQQIEQRDETAVERRSRTKGRSLKAATYTGVGLGIASLLAPAGALAVDPVAPTVDYSKATEGITTEIGKVVPIALVIVGIITGILVAVGFLRKMGVAKKVS